MSHFAALTATEFPQDLKAVFEKEMPDSSVVDFVARKMKQISGHEEGQKVLAQPPQITDQDRIELLAIHLSGKRLEPYWKKTENPAHLAFYCASEKSRKVYETKRIDCVRMPDGRIISCHHPDFYRLYEMDHGKVYKREYGPLHSPEHTANAEEILPLPDYDALGNLLTRTDKNGNIWSYTYDADGWLTQETDPLGRKTAYVYDANGNLTKVTTPLGNVTTYTYDEMDRRTGETDPLGHTTTFLYDDLGRVVGMINKGGVQTSQTYDANGNLLTATDELGHVTSYEYDALGRMTKLTDPKGGVTTYAYDLAGNLTSQTNALGNATTWVYDAKGNLLSQTDPLGNETAYAYDKDGRCVSITDANGGVTAAEYDGNGNIVKITDPEENVTTYTYTARNQLASYTDAAGYTFSYTYDGNGNVLTYTDGNGNTTVYQYDGLDRAVKRTDAAGNSATNEYDADGRMVKAVNEEGAVTSYTYDSDSRLISMTDALGHVTAFEYDAMDRVTKVTDALNNATTYTYDAAGNITSSTDAKGVTTTYTYDANGNLLTVTDAAGTVTYAYDALDQAVSVTDRNGNTQSFTYDAAGRIVKVTDKNGNETKYTYDGNGNIVKTTDALGTDVLFEYNANDQLIKMTQNRVDSFNEQSETLVTLYEYDGRNLVTKVVRSDNNQELYTYDGNGNMISKTDGDGYVTEYTYNSLDLVSHINYNDAKEVTYQYNKVGELVKMDDWLGTTTFEVDLLGQLKKVTDHKGKVVSYAYDAVGNQTAVTYPDETTVTKTYDEVYNLTKVTDAESQNYTYVYDDAGRVTKLTYPNGWVEDYTYDAEGNLLKTVDTDPFHNNKKSTKYEYRYDAEGNLVSEYKRDTTASNRALTTTYTYDGLNRVISAHEEAVGHNTTRTYLYDTLGNLIREEQDGCVEYKYNGFALDESKKCGTIPNSIGTSFWEYTYDGRGNLVSNDKYTRTTSGMAWQNEETYVYDETNHMVDGKNEKGERSLYTYNGLGLRVGRELIMQDNTHGYTDFHDETPSVETGIDKPEVAVESYVIDYTSPTFRTLTMEEEGGFDYRWVYGLDKLSVKITSEGTNWWGQNVKQDILKDYLHQDRLGSTTNLTDKFGRVVGRADYNEWGEITYKDALDITSAYRRIYPQLNYTGHDWDDVLEMYYAKARFYDPDAKRFVEIDPVKGQVTDPLSLVSYLYCVDNPLRWVDPLGLERIVISGNHLAYPYPFKKYAVANFVEPAIRTIREWLNDGVNNESITWILVGSGYDGEDFLWSFVKVLYNIATDYPDYFSSTTVEDSNGEYVVTMKDGVHKLTLKVIANRNELHDHIIDGIDRDKEKITETIVFSHGEPEKLSLGYLNMIDLFSITSSDVSNWGDISSAFSDDYFCVLYACNMGTEKNGTSFAQAWADATGGYVIGLTPSSDGSNDVKTTYGGIDKGRSYKKFSPKWLEFWGGVKFYLDGSWYYPTMSLEHPGTWKLFRKNMSPISADSIMDIDERLTTLPKLKDIESLVPQILYKTINPYINTLQ